MYDIDGRGCAAASGLFTSRLPPLTALRYFEVAARHSSFALAAKELNVTPAAISHRVKALEEMIGVNLFMRSHRKVKLTPAGRAALPTIQRGFSALLDGINSARAHGEDRLVVTICAEPLFATKWLVPRLHRFYEQSPEAEVRLQASLASVDMGAAGPVDSETYLRGGIDLSVRLGYGSYHGLWSKKLLEVRLTALAAPQLLAAAPVAEPSDLLRHPLLRDGTLLRAGIQCGWREWFSHAGVRLPADAREHHYGNGLLALEAATTGQGVLLASRELVTAELDAHKLVQPCNDEISCPLAYRLVCPPGELDRQIVRQFRSWLLKEAGCLAS
ncbi:LysR family transcriptional regulator [Mesorhizobium sp. M8A.F.Ca.ET.173.01.1.1]|nr:LysR family transcriptional regulator [Mesorhizobium sp. M8A.F.Ca.ET.173.01.1.1]